MCYCLSRFTAQWICNSPKLCLWQSCLLIMACWAVVPLPFSEHEFACVQTAYNWILLAKLHCKLVEPPFSLPDNVCQSLNATLAFDIGKVLVRAQWDSKGSLLMVVTVMFFPWRVLYSNQLQTLALSGNADIVMGILESWFIGCLIGIFRRLVMTDFFLFYFFSKHCECMHRKGLLYIHAWI